MTSDTDRRQQNATAIRDMLAAGDAHDLAKFQSYLAPEFEFVFGNSKAVADPHEWRANAESFHRQFAGLEHRIVRIWTPADDIVIAVLNMGYHRTAGTVVDLPCCDIFRMNTDIKIASYRIYMDLSPALS
jgi:ketosteroid isomerase-like protein